jgi:hypothetical protein
MFALLVDLHNFDLDATMSNQQSLRAKFEPILMVPDALHLLKILRHNFSKYGKVAAGVASHVLSDRSAGRS